MTQNEKNRYMMCGIVILIFAAGVCLGISFSPGPQTPSWVLLLGLGLSLVAVVLALVYKDIPEQPTKTDDEITSQ